MRAVCAASNDARAVCVRALKDCTCKLVKPTSAGVTFHTGQCDSKNANCSDFFCGIVDIMQYSKVGSTYANGSSAQVARCTRRVRRGRKGDREHSRVSLTIDLFIVNICFARPMLASTKFGELAAGSLSTATPTRDNTEITHADPRDFLPRRHGEERRRQSVSAGRHAENAGRQRRERRGHWEERGRQRGVGEGARVKRLWLGKERGGRR